MHGIVILAVNDPIGITWNLMVASDVRVISDVGIISHGGCGYGGTFSLDSPEPCVKFGFLEKTLPCLNEYGRMFLLLLVQK